MNANQVRAIVASMYSDALQSPAAMACATGSSINETNRAISFAKLQSAVADASAKQLRRMAIAHAEACLQSCDGWDAETLSHNIQSEFGRELSEGECDDIARAALANIDGVQR